MNRIVRINADFDSDRLRFVLDLVFVQLLGIDYHLSKDDSSPHLLYSNSVGTDSVTQIPLASDLLFRFGFDPITVATLGNGKSAKLFPATTPADFDFDLFAAIFYLVSRYEEYSGFVPDTHKRFPPEASILHKLGALEYPLVNIWVLQLKEAILKKWPDLEFKPRKFQYISTIDIDSTFQYREKGWIWSLSGLIKDVVTLQFLKVLDRIKTLAALKPDDFDVFERVEKQHIIRKIEVVYFWLLGDYGPFDKNIFWNNKAQKSILKKLAETHTIGIHPSYASNDKPWKLKIELERFKSLTGKEATKSRQHFLIHSFPKTYQNLLKNNLSEDYTLGYTSVSGFRAGIAAPFYFFDLETNTATPLKLFPFCSMDITAMHYDKMSIEQAIQKNKNLIKAVKEVDGLFISLWHNESLSGVGRWQGGWPQVYFSLLEEIA